jgi:hypothetical protein
MKYFVHLSLALVLSAFALGYYPASLSAEDKPSMQSRPFQEKLAALLDDETLCVVYVDFTKIDTDVVLVNSQAFVEKLFEKAGLTEADRAKLLDLWQSPGGAKMPLNWDLAKVCGKTGKAFLVDSLGVREAFLVVQTGGKSFPALVWAAIPKHEKLNVSMIKVLLKEQSALFRETDDFCFITDPTLARRIDIANVGPNRAAARPEFAEAHAAVENCPVQVLVAPPKYVKKVFREVKPTLQDGFDKIDLASVIDTLRWKAVGVNPEKLEFVAVTEAESEKDAQTLYRETSEFYAIASEKTISKLREQKESRRDRSDAVRDASKNPQCGPILSPEEFPLLDAYPEIINEESLKRLGEYLIPKPEGKRFVVKGGAEALQNALDKNATVLFAAIRKIVESEQERQRKLVAQNQLKQVGLGMHNYHDAHKTFPPPYSVDKNGKPLHSWRVLILPYLDEDDLAKKIRLDEPWDSEYNKQFHDKMPSVFYNPTYHGSNKKGETNFCMVVGPETLGQANGKGLKISEIKDGTAYTVMLIERQTPVCWMAPEDIEQEKAYLGINRDPAGIGGKTPGGVFAAYADGSVRFIEQDTPLDKLKALLTIAGREAQ